VLTENIKHVASIYKMQFIFNQPLPKKFIKEHEVAKVRYHKCIDRNVQCGQGENPNEEDFPCLVCYKLNSDNGEEI
jgi:hypothetical protein